MVSATSFDLVFVREEGVPFLGRLEDGENLARNKLFEAVKVPVIRKTGLGIGMVVGAHKARPIVGRSRAERDSRPAGRPEGGRGAQQRYGIVIGLAGGPGGKSHRLPDWRRCAPHLTMRVYSGFSDGYRSDHNGANGVVPLATIRPSIVWYLPLDHHLLSSSAVAFCNPWA